MVVDLRPSFLRSSCHFPQAAFIFIPLRIHTLHVLIGDLHKKMSMNFRLSLGEFLYSSKKIILLPSGFSRHPFGFPVLHPNEYLDSLLSLK